MCIRDRSHSTPTLISKSLDVSVSSVRRIVREDLKLKPFKKIKAQKLTLSDVQKRVDHCKKLLRNITKEKLNITFFTAEKVFKLQDYHNSQNCRVFAPNESKKCHVVDEHLYFTKQGYPKSVMVSMEVSKLGKT